MGYEHVEGKLYCGRDSVQLQFKLKDRAFKKNESQTVTFDYGEVEKVEFISRWFRPKVLVFLTRSPEKLDQFPGASVGRVELTVIDESIKDARKVAGLIDFKQSEAFVVESERRLNRNPGENE